MRHAVLSLFTLLLAFACAACGPAHLTLSTPSPASSLHAKSATAPSPTPSGSDPPAVPSCAPPSLGSTPTPAGLPTDDRVLANLVAFARLYGLLRYFHPSDAATAARWGSVAENGATLMAGAVDPHDLAARLQAFFEPIAPTLCVFVTRQVPAAQPELSPPPGTTGLEVMMWRHYGVDGRAEYSIYRSDLVRAPAPGGMIPEGFLDPRRPYLADLGSDVAALVPLALFADGSGTLPHHEVLEDEAPDRAMAVTGLGVRAAGVVVAWNALAYFYPYFDVVGTDWPQVLEAALVESLAADGPRATLTLLQRLAARLNDGHATVMSRSVRDQFVPELLLAWVEGQVAILHAQGSAARLVRPGDVVLAIDGKPVLQALATAEELISGATSQWRHTVAFQTLLQGKEDSTLTLEVQRPGGLTLSVDLQRVAYLWSVTESRPATIQELEPGIYYVDLDRAYYQNFLDTLPRLLAARGIVFDLRGYPKSPEILRHLIDTLVWSPQFYVPVVTHPDPARTTYDAVTWQLEPTEPHLGARLAFLIDGRAFSAAETFLGIVEHYGLGELVGEPTAGTNGNINQIVLPGNYLLYWTGMRVLKQDGSSHHGVGILPTIPVSRTLEGIRQGRDEPLERALELLRPP